MDDNLREFCTDRQLEILLAYDEHKTTRKTAKALGTHHSVVARVIQAVNKKAAQKGYAPDSDLTRAAPEGFNLDGFSDMRTNPEGKPVWLKYNRDKQQQEEAFQAALEAFKDEILPRPPTAKPVNTFDHLLTVYPLGDHHLGMLAWAAETGETDYDLKRGEELLTGAMSYLVDTAPDARQAAILILGDFMHYDGMMPVTPTHGHLLDADSRFPKMVRSAIKSIQYMVRAALTKHEHVRLVIEIGNHDLSSAIFLMECFHTLYQDEPRITVDNSPRNIHAFTFGKNLIVTTHGDKLKPAQIPEIVAHDYYKEWGQTIHRVCHTGHRHHDEIKDYVGMTVETHRILPPADAHSALSGYRSRKSMKSISYHAEFGEVARYNFNPAMLGAAEENG